MTTSASAAFAAEPSANRSETTKSAKSASDSTSEATKLNEEERRRETAREAFARGVEHFQSSQFEPAARAFLRADSADPDSDALSNALVASQKSGSHLLVVEVAKRALNRTGVDPVLVTRSREGLAAAARHLALLRLSCRPAPCSIEVDGQKIGDPELYVHPGTRRMIARRLEGGEKGATKSLPLVERVGVVEAGTTYEFHFDLEEPREAPRSSGAVASKSGSEKDEGARKTGPVDEIVFFSGAAVTAGLGVAVALSGLDATNAKSQLGDAPQASSIDDVRGRIVRTDVLVGATIATGVFSLAWGLFATDFVFEEHDVQIAAGPDSFFGSVGGRF